MGIVYAKDKSHGIQAPKINYDDCDSVETREINLEGVRARVDRIHINGLARTKNDYVEGAVQDLFQAVDFQDVLLKAHTVRNKLNSLGCFQNIGVFIDTSKGAKATPEGLEVTFYVRELKRVIGGINTQVGENEGSLVIGLRAPNMFGRGERVQTEFSYGSKNTNNFNVSFIKPFTGKRSPVFSSSIYQATSEWPSSGYKQVDLGLILDFGLHSWPLIKHNFQWDVAIRDLSVLTKGSSFAIREESGVSLKSALRHILSVDVRDDNIFPSCGSLFKYTTEFAGAGGDVGFVKNDVFLQTNYSLFSDCVVQASANAGILNSLGNDWRLGLMDMYYLGGPLSLRGFRMRGVGPHSEGDALGSTWFWGSGLHLFTPLPFRPGKGGFGELFRTHLFVNAGNIGNFEGEEAFVEKVKTNIRVAYGIGLAMRLGQMARIEINYCFPHSFQETDLSQPGVQFGIGVQFL
ncbi:hypothetical protein PPYR_02980 [Photinus pyralis]|uniref:Bacterial surface antigen (D15) domain-containing protein n=1 Tax=Photinus pyralis TaxID=7054 RepID=A0A1Y1JXG6_PHOPY|nr:sorting and assembly machinery component 50 homolog A [Photinus pyralis]KAB0791180.1 hypothetical protein PPYR_02980 [Photinus pyralis]